MSISQRVIQQVKINNIVSGIAKCWKIKHSALYYTNNIQNFDAKKIEKDQKVITTIKQHPVFIVSNYFKHPLN